MSRGAERTLVARYPDWSLVATGVDESVPVAVVAANRVVALSSAAREEGVKEGLRRREAQGRCPELEVVQADPSQETRRWLPVVAAVESFALGVEIVGPGILALATRGPSRYFGGDVALAAKVGATIDDVLGRCGARIGVADGRFAAGLASRLDLTPRESASVIVTPGESRIWLAPLPVTSLDLPELTGLLIRLGIRTLGDLAALPAPSLLARFGPIGAMAHRLACGLDEQPLAGRTPPPDLAVVAELDPPAERVDRVAFVAKALADELHEGLAVRGLACTRVLIEAETEHGEHLSRRWRHDGALTAGAMAERVRWQLDSWLTDRLAGAQALGPEPVLKPSGTTGGLTLLRLVPDEVRPDHGRQLGFWGGSAEGDHRVARSLARVQGMLGPEEVLTGVLGGGRDPADQVRLVPWGDPREPARLAPPVGRLASPPVLDRSPDRSHLDRASEQSKGRRLPGARTGSASGTGPPSPPWPGRLPGPAPAVVHQPPISAEVFDATDQPVEVTGRGVVSAAPSALVLGGRRQVVVGWSGPWPVEERWWEPSGRRRARFQVVLEDGSAHLVVREEGQWWVAATYD